jgi:LL-diaminopimelate aminotransferase
MPLQAKRLDLLPPYVFSVIGDRIRQLQTEGVDVFRLDIGNPDMPPPDAVIDALAKSARHPGHHGYTGYRGISSFREAIATQYHRRFGVSLDPDTEVLPLIGSKEAIINLSLAYLDAGDIALVPDIGYPSYAMGARLAGAEICWVPLNEQHGFQPDLSRLGNDVLSRAKLLWVNYPNNPTGTTIGLGTYRELYEFCSQHDILLVSDNPYMDVMFDGITAYSALQAGKENVLELFSFSKSYNMAGWRLGAALGSADAISKLLRVKSNIDSGHFAPIYEAGNAALQTPQSWIDERNRIYQLRRDRVMDALPQLGLSARQPQGSLYVWARVQNGSALDYVEKALTEASVSIAPGAAYGPGGDNYVRISIGIPDKRLDEALARLKTWYDSR